MNVRQILALTLYGTMLLAGLSTARAATIDFSNQISSPPLSAFSNTDVTFTTDFNIEASTTTAPDYPFSGLGLTDYNENLFLEFQLAFTQPVKDVTFELAPLISYENIVQLYDEPLFYVFLPDGYRGWDVSTRTLGTGSFSSFTFSFPDMSPNITEAFVTFGPGYALFDEPEGQVAKYFGLGITSISYTPAIPEPETYAMMLAGLGIIGWMSRRRASQHAKTD